MFQEFQDFHSTGNIVLCHDKTKIKSAVASKVAHYQYRKICMVVKGTELLGVSTT